MKLGVNLYKELSGTKALESSNAIRPAHDFTFEEEQANMPPLKRYILITIGWIQNTHNVQSPDRPFLPGALEDHYNAKHLKLAQYKCPVEDCGKSFGNRQTLKKRKKLHEVDEEQVLKCTTTQACNFQCIKQADMESHQRRLTDPKIFLCEMHDECKVEGKAFRKREDLLGHYRSYMVKEGTGELIRCRECNKGFKNTSRSTWTELI